MAFYRRLRKAFFARSAPENGWQSVFGGVFSRLQTPLEPRDRLKSGVFDPIFHGRKMQIARFQRFSDLRRRLSAVYCLCSPHRPTGSWELPPFNLAEYVILFSCNVSNTPIVGRVAIATSGNYFTQLHTTFHTTYHTMSQPIYQRLSDDHNKTPPALPVGVRLR